MLISCLMVLLSATVRSCARDPANSEIVPRSEATITQQFSVALTVVSFGRIPLRHVSVGAGPLSRQLDGRQPGGRHRINNPKSGSWVIAYWGRIGGAVGDGHI